MSDTTEAIRVVCPKCKAVLKVTRMLNDGVRVSCPGCGEPLRFQFDANAKNARSTAEKLANRDAVAETPRATALSASSQPRSESAKDTSELDSHETKPSEFTNQVERLRREKRVFELEEELEVGNDPQIKILQRWARGQQKKSNASLHEAEIQLLSGDFVEAFRLAGIALQHASDNSRADEIRLKAERGLANLRWKRRARSVFFAGAAIIVSVLGFYGVSHALHNHQKSLNADSPAVVAVEETPTESGDVPKETEPSIPVLVETKAATTDTPVSSTSEEADSADNVETESEAGSLRTLGSAVDSVAVDDLAQQTVLVTSNGQSETVEFRGLSSKSQDQLSAMMNGTGTRDVTGLVVPERTSRKWALLVGVNDYDHLPDLNYCEADMQALRERIVALGFPNDQIIQLTSNSINESERPSKANIVRELNRLLSGGIYESEKGVVVEPRLVGSEDTIVVAFSGHGVHLDGVSHFCPTEANLQDPEETMISMNSIYEHLASVTDGLRLLLVDACRNQTSDSDADIAGKTSAFQLGYVPPGIAAISSCSEGQVSHEDRRLGHGIFSYYLLGGLAGAGMNDQGDDGYVDIKLSQLTSFTVDSTMQYTRNWLKADQVPHSLVNVEGNPVLGRLKVEEAISSDDLNPTYQPGPQTGSYSLNLHKLKPQELPYGWTVPEHVVTRLSASGRPVLCSNVNIPSDLISPRLNLQQDFSIEIEVSCNSEFHLSLTGEESEIVEDDLTFGFCCNLRNSHYRFRYRLPTHWQSRGEWQHIPVYDPEGHGTILIRLERRGQNFKILFNNDERRCVHFRNTKVQNFERIGLRLTDSGVKVHALRVGPLHRHDDNVVETTMPYQLMSSSGRLPDGWTLCGEAVDGRQRLLSPEGAIKIQGDFDLYFTGRIQTKRGAAFRLRLIGADGGRTLPIEFLAKDGDELSVVFPKHQPGSDGFNIPRGLFEMQLIRMGNRMELRLGNINGDARTICVLPNGGGFRGFNQIEIDDWSGRVSIPTLRVSAVFETD